MSNVTGLIADVDRIAIALHRHGALAFFDYASGAPYLRMDMNPNPTRFGGDDASKDAVYFSPHKCYGGTSTPGVLVIKKHVSFPRALKHRFCPLFACDSNSANVHHTDVS